jgi:adenylate cyclase
MSDVFISYSNFDRDKASKLSQKLRDAGFSVWIDETNISAATQWSSEIVKAIEDCKVFLILLSEHSFGSHNVIKELSLASEEKRHILPVDLENVELTYDVKYQLAGIQRVPYKEYDRIEIAIRRFISAEPEPSKSAPPQKKRKPFLKYAFGLGVAALAIAAYFFLPGKHEALVQSAQAAEIKKMVVLPFESLSANKEDEYFADGLTAQVITTLSGLNGMQVTDRQTAMHYKGRKSDLGQVAKELGIRYVVDGTVQKQDKNVKITSELIDAESGKVLLSNTFDGTMDDLFGLEEKLARSIAFELQGSLMKQNFLDSVVLRQGTKNPEAYNKFIIGIGYLENVQSKAQAEKGLSYIEEALKLDPKYAYAQYVHALYFMARYQVMPTSDPRDLDVSDSLLWVTLQLDPSLTDAHFSRAIISVIRQRPDSALKEFNIVLRTEPDNIKVHAIMGSFYYNQGQFDLAAEHLEKAVQKNIIDLASWSFLIDCLQALGDTVKRNRYIDESSPLYELYLEKNPTNATVRLQYALNLANRNLKEKTHQQLALILKSTELNGLNYYNIACAYSRLGEVKSALDMLRTSLDKGYRVGALINTDPDFASLHTNPEFQALAKRESEGKISGIQFN